MPHAPKLNLHKTDYITQDAATAVKLEGLKLLEGSLLELVTDCTVLQIKVSLSECALI